MKSENIQTMEEFIEKLPPELLSNYNLMYDSKSLHGSSFENPRAILFNKKADWIVTFNGNESQAAGSMIEMMIYEPETKKYSFHEIDFTNTPKINEAPTKCLACHGSTPRPIWDQYNQWPGAYGDNDDRPTPTELENLQKFIKLAPTHPRYKHLKNPAEYYKLVASGMRGGHFERIASEPNRSFTMSIYQQRINDISEDIKNHQSFDTLKPLLLYFLTKCYLAEGNNAQGDGSFIDPKTVLPDILKNILNQKAPNFPYTFNPEHSLDYFFTRLGVNTTEWFLNSRSLSNYRGLKDGTDRTHEQWLARLLEKNDIYRDQYKFEITDFRTIKPTLARVIEKQKTCSDLFLESVKSIKALDALPPSPPPPGPSERGMEEVQICRGVLGQNCRTVYKTLPQICFKCHTQKEGESGRVYLPFHKFPEMAEKGDTVLVNRMYRYISAFIMPRRENGDDREYQQYFEKDYPRLKKYLETLLKRTL